MSTDTDYVITIKGKDAALRKAAADFIELALNPWNPQRDDKKTLTRLDVFRNESNCAGFFTPSSLCEDAAKLFPGVKVGFSSKNEYGYSEEEVFHHKEGKPSAKFLDALTLRLLERVDAEVPILADKVRWLEPLVAWCTESGVSEKTLGKIQEVLRKAAEVDVAQASLKASAVSELEKRLRWSFSQEGISRRNFAVGHSRVYLSCGSILCLDLAEGQSVWKSELTDCEALVLAEEGILVTVAAEVKSVPRKGLGRGATKTSLIASLSAETGEENWRVERETNGRWYQLAASPKHTVVLSYGGVNDRMTILETNTGKRCGSVDLDVVNEYSWSHYALAVDSDRIYLCGSAVLCAFDYDGDILWRTELPADASTRGGETHISLAGDDILVLSLYDKGAAAFQCSRGALLWHSPIESTHECVIGPKAAGFFASGSGCIVRNIRDGSTLWKLDLVESERVMNMALTQESLIVETSSDVLLLADLNSGKKVGTIGLAGIDAAVWIQSSSRLSLAHDGALCCVARPTSEPSESEDFRFYCVNLGLGGPVGPWPMARQGPGGAAFLRIQERPGYKQFIKAWKNGQDLSHRLANFAPHPDSDKARVARIHGIIRGHELIAQARSWVEPSIGSGKTATARGAQWRLVMAYGGFELLAKSLAGAKDRGLDEKAVDSLISKLALPMFGPLAPPPIDKSSLKDWMDDEDASDVLDFLKMDKGDRNRLDAWLGKQKPITEWTDALLLAKALRNATAHGALSPTKVEEWKLGEPIARLTEEIFRIDEAVFEVLGQAEEAR